MNTTPKISVIVPVYNTEKYLHRCIDSILSQTFSDFELLLIDDGSKDGSGAICDEYAAKDSRVRVFHKENGGVTSARALGVSVCNGDFVTFVDSDDYLLNKGLDLLYGETGEEFDIIIGNNEVDSDSVTTTSTYVISPQYYQHILFFQYYAPWGKLYRRDLFTYTDIFDVPRNIVHGEDAIMNLRIAFLLRNNVKIIDKLVYHYSTNIESVCSKFIPNFEHDALWYDYMFKSIPNDKVYDFMHECILLRLKNRMTLTQFYIKNGIWHKIEYHKTLERDIKNSGYLMKVTDRIALKCHNPITCSLFYIIVKMIGWLRESVNLFKK